MPPARSRSRSRQDKDREGWRVLPSNSQAQTRSQQTNLPPSNTDTNSVSTSSTLRDSDASSEIKIETRSEEKGFYYVARPEPTVQKEEIGFGHLKPGGVSYGSSNEALPLPYADLPSYSYWRAGREKEDMKDELDGQEHENKNGYEYENEHEHEPRTLPMYLFFLGFLCPILWIIGTFTLRLPHTDYERRPGGRLDPSRIWSLPPEEKAEAEREVERLMRRWEVEWRWGKRCMWASIVFVGVGLVVGMAVWGVINARGRTV